MIAPTLLVGLGGTGSKIVTRVANLVTKDQRYHLGFAVFDTDINELRDIQKANPFISIIQTSTKLSVGEYLNIDNHARDTWFPVNAILNSKTLTEGAGQVRAISRLAFETALRAGKLEPLHEAIQELYKIEESQSEQALRVIIVSSLAGGTGSGLILPVALYIKNYLATHFRQSANITRGFFILPEVFDEVIRGKAQRSNLRSNAYATLRELDAFLMKGDATLPDYYSDYVKMEFPRVNSAGYDEYNIRPYDFCFLFDAQNAEGNKLNSFNQYLDHAANCIYAQSIGPMNKRSNSSEDNTIRRLCAERGRNRYAGAGSSMLIYPMEDIKNYIALNWAKNCVSQQWLVFDNMFKEMRRRNAQMRSQGLGVQEIDAATSYVTSVESMASNNDPFARSIVSACKVYDASGLSAISDKWTEYVQALVQKVKADESSGQLDLDAQKATISGEIAGLEGGKDSWQNFVQPYQDLVKYKLMIEKRCEDKARTIAYTMFKASGDSVTSDKAKHRLETYMRDSNGKFIHPNAVRYFLYNALDLMKKQLSIIREQNRTAKNYFDTFARANFSTDEDTTDNPPVENILGKKTNAMNKNLTDEQEDLKAAYLNYLTKANEYRENSIIAEVLQEGIGYIEDLCRAFQNFFLSFDVRVADIDRRLIGIAKKYENTRGMTARYVCVSPKCLSGMLDQMPYTGSSISLDGTLSEEIYNRVRKYSLLPARKEANGSNDESFNGSFFNELFENGILGYFRDTLIENYGDFVDLDIISALEAEARYSQDQYDTAMVEEYVKKAIRSTRALSCPFIEKPLGEEKDPIDACAFHPCLDPHDGSFRSRLIERELKNAGGVEDDDISKNMILFYQSFYDLRANDLSKFAPPEHSETSSRDGGEYYKAYFELIESIHPEAHRSKAITPHIDKWWHVITKIPDLDDGNQIMQEQRIYSAFFWGMIGGYVDLFDVGSDKRAYRLKVDELNMDDGNDVLVVSNGTPCDHLYEVLDAFAIYPELVRKILERVDALTIADVDKGTPIEEGLLVSCLNSFRVREYPLYRNNGIRSIFDIPILMKKSLKSEAYSEDSVLHILRSEIEEIRKYLCHFYSEKELPEVMGRIIKEQFEMYLADLEQNDIGHKSIYNDYLFSRTCSIIAKTFENLDLAENAKYVQNKARELSR